MNDTESNKSSLFGDGYVPFDSYTFQLILHPIALCICVPLNLLVGYILLFDKELHTARNTIWIGIISSNLAAFFVLSLQHFIFYQQNYVACQLFTFLAGKPYVLLLVNLLLATFDRFIYTKWPLFHRIHVTVFRVAATQLFCSVTIFLVLSYDHITGAKPIRCGLDVQHGKRFSSVFAALTTFCIVAKVIVYFMARRENESCDQDGVVIRKIKTCELKLQQPNSQASGMVRELSRSSLRMYHGSRRFRQLECNATMTLVASLVPIILMVSLSGLFLLSQSIYRHSSMKAKLFPLHCSSVKLLFSISASTCWSTCFSVKNSGEPLVRSTENRRVTLAKSCVKICNHYCHNCLQRFVVKIICLSSSQTVWRIFRILI
jgi:hypothetical protein